MRRMTTEELDIVVSDWSVHAPCRERACCEVVAVICRCMKRAVLRAGLETKVVMRCGKKDVWHRAEGEGNP